MSAAARCSVFVLVVAPTFAFMVSAIGIVVLV